MFPIIRETVAQGTQICTDELPAYKSLRHQGYKHAGILHKQEIYVVSNVHTNTIEGFWSLVKTGIRGVFHRSSPQHIQKYLSEYAFRYNHRDDDQPMFLSFLHRVGLAVGD